MGCYAYRVRPPPPGRDLGAGTIRDVDARDSMHMGLKTDGNLKPKKCKARGCARGDTTREGFEYYFKYSSTASIDAFRVFVAVCADRGWIIYEADYSTAYLNADIDTVIYMQQLPGFEQYGPNGEPMVCLLKKAIYGLKNSGRLWQQTHTRALLANGFVQCQEEHALFRNKSGGGV